MEKNVKQLGTLYIIATPIGNLEDISLRAIRILSEVDIVLAEDTRVTKKLLDFIQTKNTFPTSKFPRLLSYHQHTGEEKKLEILKYLMDGLSIALVTDAGTPGISDPGNELIEYLLSFQKDLNIVPLPGASSVTAALSVSGFNASKFTFIGFLPKKKSRKILEESLVLGIPVVFFESPYRIFKTLYVLKELKHVPVRVFIGRELTKLHEEIIRGELNSVISKLEEKEKELKRVKGEIVVILEP